MVYSAGRRNLREVSLSHPTPVRVKRLWRYTGL